MTLVVETEAGAVRGELRAGIALWKGIPYAAPPVGALRFLPPRPAVPWQGERDATRFGAAATQSRDPRAALLSGITDKIATGEDCLFVNVYAPGNAAGDRAAGDGVKRPVMVWIHGGAFIMGSGSQPLYNGTSFAAQGDVIVVTLNYRLGLFGLLYLGAFDDAYAAGNVALLDQVAALAWVQRNIAAFGGDPARVTVMGESAGAFSIGALLAMPAARGLFQRAILQSGATALAVPTRDAAVANARLVLAELGIAEDRLDALREVPAERLVAVQQTLTLTGGLGAFAPYIDGATIPRSPVELVRDGEGARVPVLLGSNRDESTLFDVFLGPAVTEIVKHHVSVALGGEAARFHAQYREARADRSEAWAWLDLIGDAAFRIPMIRLAEAAAAHAPVWMYRFDWATTAFDGRLRATHALELPFVWNKLDVPVAQLLVGGDVAGAQALATPMHAAWTAFIRGGEPAAAGLPVWPRYEVPRRATMILDVAPRIVDDPDGAQRALWERT